MLAVHKGNPKGIHSFNDLLSKKVSIITPNPFSSGSARWNIMAVYGSQIEQGKSEAQALAAVKTVLEKTQSQPGSGRDAMTAFTQGQGDVLLTYENEAIKAEKAGEDVEYVIPEDTIKIETPIAVTKKAPPQAKKFLEFIWSEAGQKIWAENGYRPVDPKLVEPEAVPHPEGPVHDRQVRRLGQGQGTVLRRKDRLGHEDRGRTRSLHCKLSSTAEPSPPPGRESPCRGAGFARKRRPGPSAARASGSAAGWSRSTSACSCCCRWRRSPRRPSTKGSRGFWEAVTAPESVAALKLTVIASLITVAINGVFGTIIAWVLVRDEFRGKAILNALIDLPFALPTIVAGITLIALYGPKSPIGVNVTLTQFSVVLALLFVTLPFVVRAVQPLLIEMDREMEEAAASLGAGGLTIFRRIIFPNLLPGIGAGVALAFARALGEFGSLILITGSIPFKTMVSSVYIFKLIEQGNNSGASAVSVVLLLASLVLLAAVGFVQRLGRRA